VIAQEYSLEIQSRLICRLAVLHNFICIHNPANIPDDTKLETASGPDEETACVEHRTRMLAEQAVGNKE
jgi:hypothetical protein